MSRFFPRSQLQTCPLCRTPWLGPGVHGVHWQVRDGVSRLVDCQGNPPPQPQTNESPDGRQSEGAQQQALVRQEQPVSDKLSTDATAGKGGMR